MEQIKLDKLLDKNCTVVLNAHYTIRLTEIVEEREKWWAYKLEKINTVTKQNHVVYYYSTNFNALQRHRRKMAKEHNNIILDVNSSSCWKGVKVRPTLFDLLIHKKREKNK